ncbi:hypothetical protein ACWGQ5_51210 [Streptomyces sp. NPDC055722]
MELVEQYKRRPFMYAELWAGKITRVLRQHPKGISEEDLAKETGLTPDEIRHGVTWRNAEIQRWREQFDPEQDSDSNRGQEQAQLVRGAHSAPAAATCTIVSVASQPPNGSFCWSCAAAVDGAEAWTRHTGVGAVHPGWMATPSRRRPGLAPGCPRGLFGGPRRGGPPSGASPPGGGSLTKPHRQR